VWGQLSLVRPNCVFHRFTPTRVGTIHFRNGYRANSPVHPHARGDNDVIFSPTMHESGSPPRAWGQSYSSLASVPFHRFTPTRVGTISVPSSFSHSVTVHPHARGDNIR